MDLQTKNYEKSSSGVEIHSKIVKVISDDSK